MADEDDKTQIYLPGGEDKAASAPSPFSGSGTPNAILTCQDVSFLEDGSTDLEIALTGSSELTVGRDEGNHVTIRSKQLSRKHARLYPGDGKWGIADMGSRNGTWVNDSNVKETWLSPGDAVKIGPIPFKYELERPDVGANAALEQQFSETIVDKTMLVGSDVRAASALLRAAEKAHDEPDAPTPPPARRAKSSAPRASAASPPVARKGGGVKIAVIAIVVLAVVGAGGYFGWTYMAKGPQRALVKDQNRDIKRFLNDHEQAIADFDADANREELSALRELLSRVNDAVRKYPGTAELQEQQIKLLFLTFERQLGALLHAKKPAKALKLHEKTTEAFDRVAAAADSGNPALAATLAEVGGLLALSEAVVRLRAFKLQYPTASEDAAAKPSKEAVGKMTAWRKKFVAEKKKNNLALSVRYRYFGKVVKEVDSRDLSVLDRWKQII